MHLIDPVTGAGVRTLPDCHIMGSPLGPVLVGEPELGLDAPSVRAVIDPATGRGDTELQGRHVFADDQGFARLLDRSVRRERSTYVAELTVDGLQLLGRCLSSCVPAPSLAAHAGLLDDRRDIAVWRI